MSERTPTRIAVYKYITGEPEQVAEFQWNPDLGVELAVFDERWSSVARRYYEAGVPLPLERRKVLRSEGSEFMRALLRRRQMSYYGFVDESNRED